MTKTATQRYDEHRSPHAPATATARHAGLAAAPEGFAVPRPRGGHRATAPGPRTAPLPVADPSAADPTADRATSVIVTRPHRAAAALDAPTVRLPVVLGVAGSKRRVRGIDAARGLALLGMIAVHTFPLADENGVTPVGLLAGGTSAALFAVLAGVSVALLTGRQRVVPSSGSAARQGLRLAVRGLVVGVLGLALGQAALGSVDIILTYYGVLFLLAVPLVLLSTRALFVVGALVVVIAPITSFVIRAQLPPTEQIDPSFTALVSDPGGLLTTLFLTGAYPIWPWLAYLCVGIAVGRCSLRQVRTAGWLVVSGAVLVLAAAAISHVALVGLGGLGHITANPGLPAEELRAALTEGPNGVTPTTTWWWLAVDTAHSSTPLSMARTIGTSLLALGAMLLVDRGLDRARPARALQMAGAAQAPLAAAGAMTLTFYTLHVIFAGIATELDPWILYLVQVLFALLAGMLWQRLVGRGPLEAGVSTLVDAVVTSPSAMSATSTRKRIATIVVALALTTIVGLVLAVADGPSGDSGLSTTSEREESAEPEGTSTLPDADDQVESDPPGQPTQPAQPGQLDEPSQLDEPEEPDQPGAPDGQGEQDPADDD